MNKCNICQRPFRFEEEEKAGVCAVCVRDVLDAKELRTGAEELRIENEQLKTETMDLAALIKQLARQIPENKWAKKALDYLVRKGLEGSILRDVT